MYIIAEAGLNFRGELDTAKKYASIALDCGADAIKYQYTNVNETWNNNSQWYSDLAGNIRQSIKSCEMNKESWRELKLYCDDIGIEFICTPSTIEIMKYLVSIGTNIIKIGSDRTHQEDLINESINHANKVFISTGHCKPKNNNCVRFYCVSKYPTLLEQLDLHDLNSGYYQGFSDHTLRYDDLLPMVINQGPIKYWEKHFKIDDDCIDTNTSLNPENFKQFVKNVRMYCR